MKRFLSYHPVLAAGIVFAILMWLSPDIVPAYDDEPFGLPVWLFLLTLGLPFTIAAGIFAEAPLPRFVVEVFVLVIGLGVYALVDYILVKWSRQPDREAG